MSSASFASELTLRVFYSWVSEFVKYSSHTSSSIAIPCHRWTSPSLLSFVRVVFASVVGLVMLVSVHRIDGSSLLRYFTMAFLFVMMIPPMGLGWLMNAVSVVKGSQVKDSDVK